MRRHTCHLVRGLSALGDLFVNDAFGTAHRSQPTMVGIPIVMKSVAGLLMEREVLTLSKVFSNAPRPVSVVLGGTKVDDSIAVAHHMLTHQIADQVIVIGVVANIFLQAMGYDIGRPSAQLIQHLRYEKEVGKARELLREFGERIVVPEWIAVREEGARNEYPVSAIPPDAPVLDIGMDSILSLSDRIRESGTVVFNGPAGVFEDRDFATGTIELLKAASKTPFSIIGGGHTAAVVEQLWDREGLHPYLYRWRGMHRISDREKTSCRRGARAFTIAVRVRRPSCSIFDPLLSVI